MTELAATIARRSWTSLALLALSFRVHLIFFIIPVAYLAGNTVLFSFLEKHGTAPLKAILFDLVVFSIPAGLLSLFVVRLLQYALVLKPVSPTKQMLADITSLFKRPSHIIVGVPVVAAMVLFNKAMFELKPAIPELKPFSWDETLAHWDRLSHFGYDPWVMLQPILGYDYVTFALNICYNFWFLILFGTWMWFGFQSRATELRTRFFLSYMAIWWLGGGLMALYFSSAGPVYYGAIGLTPDPFAPLMAYHHDVDTRIDLLFLDAQQLLWNGYTGKTAAIGISAFPSIHNASATLFALALTAVSRRAGMLMYIYATLIFIGSVHLGWHYAIDGYAGMLIAMIAWYATAPIARWHARQPSTQQLNQHLASL